MEDKQKNSIANELYFIGKCYIIGLIILSILALLINGEVLRWIGELLLESFIFVGIGYAIRLIKWVFKWKS